MNWPLATTPWTPHQPEGFAFATNKPASMIAGGMGIGKSIIGLAAIAAWQAKRVLILCPPSVRSVWRREVAKHCPENMRAVVLDRGTVAQRTAAADQALQYGQPTAIAINYEACWREPFASWALSHHWDAVVLDEAHAIKTDEACCSRFASRLTPISGRRMCLSGTFMAHSPLDAWGTFRFLQPDIFGDDHDAYLKRYLAPRQIRQRKNLRNSHNAVTDAIVDCFGADSPLLSEWGDAPDYTAWLPGLQNAGEFQDKIRPLTWICKSADVLNLPPLIQDERTVELGPEARRLYCDLLNTLYADIGAGVPINSNLTLLVRLQSITSGFVTDQAGHLCRLDHNPKRDALYDLLAEARGEPAVVFCRFVADLDTVQEVCKQLGLRYAELSHRRKDAVTDMATLAEGIDVAGVQPQSGGVGIDLSRAKIGVWFSFPRPLYQVDQAVSRLHRPGTTGVRFYSLVAADTIDVDILESIRDKREIIDGVLARLKRQNTPLPVLQSKVPC